MSMITLPPDVTAHLLANCPGRTDEALQPRFGISYNTWRKIEHGLGVRRSVAERLVQRVTAEWEKASSGRENETLDSCDARKTVRRDLR